MSTRKVQCPNCGASVTPTGTCRFCGSTAFVDGVAGKLLPSTLRCPRCKGKPLLQGLEHDGVRADLCMTCHGVWFGPGQLEEAIRRATKRPVAEGEGGESPVHGGVEPVRYALCPVCDGGMARNPFSRKPLVIIDRCPSHGDWCDGGELSQLKVVARSRGADALGAPDPNRALERKKGEPREKVSLPIEPFGTKPAGIFSLGRRRRGPDLFDMLFDGFFKI